MRAEEHEYTAQAYAAEGLQLVDGCWQVFNSGGLIPYLSPQTIPSQFDEVVKLWQSSENLLTSR